MCDSDLMQSDRQSPQPRPGAVRSSHAAETLRLYAGDWAHFARFCAAHGAPALPATPELVVRYLQHDGAGPAVLRRRVAAIGQHHRQRGLPVPGSDPVVRRVLRQARAAAPPGRRTPAPSAASLQLMAQRCARDLTGLRDRAVLLLLAEGLSRRAIVGLQAERLRFEEAGVRLLIGDAVVLVPRHIRHDCCPVRALEEWLLGSGTQYGPVFRKVTRWGTVEPQALGADAVRLILARQCP